MQDILALMPCERNKAGKSAKPRTQPAHRRLTDSFDSPPTQRIIYYTYLRYKSGKREIHYLVVARSANTLSSKNQALFR